MSDLGNYTIMRTLTKTAEWSKDGSRGFAEFSSAFLSLQHDAIIELLGQAILQGTNRLIDQSYGVKEKARKVMISLIVARFYQKHHEEVAALSARVRDLLSDDKTVADKVYKEELAMCAPIDNDKYKDAIMQQIMHVEAGLAEGPRV